MQEIDDARYVALTTFRKDGSPKATPVWIVGSAGTYRFYTGLDSWKVKRLRDDPRVEVRVSDMRGRVEPHATVYRGTGHLLEDEAAIEAVKSEVLEKYGWQARLVRLTDAIKARRGKEEPPVGVKLRLD